MMERFKWKNIIILIISILVLILIYLYFDKLKLSEWQKNKIIEYQKKEEVKKNKKKKEKIKKELNESLKNEVEAKAFLVKDWDGNIIFEKNKNRTLPIASLTKIMNSLVALEKKDFQVYLNSIALKSNGNYGLIRGEKFNLRDAIDFMLVGSVNDMAVAISFSSAKNNYVKNWSDFIDRMNQKAVELGMKNTLFFTETGLNVNSKIMGAYSTAEDISYLVKYFYKSFPELASKTASKTFSICSQIKCHNIENTNLILKKYPEIIFSKTGWTNKSRGSLAVVIEKNNQRYIFIILSSGKKGRFDDFKKLYKGLEKYLLIAGKK